MRGIAAARAATAAAAMAADCFGDALVGAGFHARCLFYKRPLGVNLPASGLIDFFFVRATVAIGDAFGSDVATAAGDAKIFAFAFVFDLRLLRRLRHEAAHRFRFMATAVRAAAARFTAGCPRQDGNEHQDHAERG